MNWSREVYIDYNRVNNKMNQGYEYLVDKYNPKPDDVDNDHDEFLYKLLGKLNVKSFYHIGFNLGYSLINVSRLYPEIKVGGMTWFDGSVFYGNELFNFKDYNFDITIGEYPYKPINRRWDFIFLGRLPSKSNLGRVILDEACNDTNKYVLFF